VNVITAVGASGAAGAGAADGNACVMVGLSAGAKRSGGAVGSRAEAGAAMLKTMTKSIVVRKTRDIFSS